MATSVSTFDSRLVALPVRDIDTDQIIPARFLKVTDKEGLADCLFADWRSDPAFMLNRPENNGAEVLVAGDNFGCGSSREHAPWALVAYGFRAVVSTRFADIFKNNALKNGLLPIEVSAEVLERLFALRAADPSTVVCVDLRAQTLSYPGGSVRFEVDGFARMCLLQGVDQLGYLSSLDARIREYEERHAALAT
jgi:3-isopropylmalate/(R)-2-methylmalate dehydratase small subunit